LPGGAQHAQNRCGATVFRIDHHVVRPHDHFSRARDATRFVAFRGFQQPGCPDLDVVVQTLGNIWIVVGYVINDRQQVGAGCFSPSGIGMGTALPADQGLCLIHHLRVGDWSGGTIV
jgi:hypothetical protein